MTATLSLPRLLVCLSLVSAAVGCAGRVAPATPATPVAVVETAAVELLPPTVPVAPVRDVAGELIALSTRHFEQGKRELELGHLASAKAAFDRAVDVLLDTPSGARSDGRTREFFDALVERISAYEVTALAQGDGFVEKKYEPAAIDALLAESLTTEPPEPTRQTTDAVALDLETTTYDIDIPLNPRVLAFVEAFSGRLKSYLEEALGRAAQYLPMIQSVFRAEGLPLDLAYVPLVESAFKPNAVSRAKAKGLWQFMAGTGRENGLRQDWYVDERAEPEKATRAAAKYLKALYATFGDWHLALASYNGGPGRIQKAVARVKRPDFWALSSKKGLLPRETRDYVPLILAAVIVAKNPAQYGLSILPVEPPATETVAVPSPVDLRRLAEWADAPIELLQALNPELRRWTTPVRATNYQLRVPVGTAEAVLTKLADADPSGLVNLSYHTVRKGETLLGISKKLKVSRTDLAEANYLTIRSKVTAGQQLVVPRAPTTLLAGGAFDTAPQRVARVASPDAPRSRTRAAVPATVIYRVRRGDTLSAIAARFDVTVGALRSWNGLRGSALQIGQRLRVSDGSRESRATR